MRILNIVALIFQAAFFGFIISVLVEGGPFKYGLPIQCSATCVSAVLLLACIIDYAKIKGD